MAKQFQSDAITVRETAIFKRQSVGKDDTYSRIDYILLSPAMARDWLQNKTYASTVPNWGVASDHRPIVAAFETEK